MKENDGQFDRVAEIMVGKGNFSSFFLILVPLFLDVAIRFSLSGALYAIGLGAAALFCVVWLEYKLGV